MAAGSLVLRSRRFAGNGLTRFAGNDGWPDEWPDGRSSRAGSSSPDRRRLGSPYPVADPVPRLLGHCFSDVSGDERVRGTSEREAIALVLPEGRSRGGPARPRFRFGTNR